MSDMAIDQKQFLLWLFFQLRITTRHWKLLQPQIRWHQINFWIISFYHLLISEDPFNQKQLWQFLCWQGIIIFSLFFWLLTLLHLFSEKCNLVFTETKIEKKRYFLDESDEFILIDDLATIWNADSVLHGSAKNRTQSFLSLDSHKRSRTKHSGCWSQASDEHGS